MGFLVITTEGFLKTGYKEFGVSGILKPTTTEFPTFQDAVNRLSCQVMSFNQRQPFLQLLQFLYIHKYMQIYNIMYNI